MNTISQPSDTNIELFGKRNKYFSKNVSASEITIVFLLTITSAKNHCADNFCYKSNRKGKVLKKEN